MSEQTNIPWCDSTWNPWIGCAKVSAGCANCYSEGLSNRKLGNIGQWGKGAPRKWHESAVKLAHRLNRKPWVCDRCGAASKDAHCEICTCLHDHSFHRRRVFSLSLGDIADPEIDLGWFNRAMVTIDECRNMTWILATKQPEEFLTRWQFCVSHWGRTDNRLPSNIIQKLLPMSLSWLHCSSRI